MNKRTAIYLRQYLGLTCTGEEPADNLASVVRGCGDILVSIYCDDARMTGRGKNAGWRRLLDDLDYIDQIVLANAGDLPGKTVADLLGLLAILTGRGVTLVVPATGVDTGSGPAAVLALIRVYRAAKKSAAIKTGQQRARVAGKHIGRPPIPENVRRRIAADLAGGGSSIRGTARKYRVAPSSVVTIKKTIMATVAEAA